MNPLDKMVKKERQARYKRLVKIRKARDMSKKYRKRPLRLSVIDSYLGPYTHNELFLSDLAKFIMDRESGIIGLTIRPPRPVSQKK